MKLGLLVKHSKRVVGVKVETNLVMMVSHMSPQLVFMGIPLATIIIRASMIIFSCVCTHVGPKIEVQRECLQSEVSQ